MDLQDELLICSRWWRPQYRKLTISKALILRAADYSAWQP